MDPKSVVSSFGKKFILSDPYSWAILFSIYVFHYIWTRRRLFYLYWQLPGPIPIPFGSTIVSLLFGSSTVLPSLRKVFRKYAPHKMIRVWFSGELMVLVADPSVINQVSTLTLTKMDVYQYLGEPYFKTGIFVDKDIPHWRKSRKVIAQVFNFKVLKCYIKIFQEESLILVNKLQEFSNSGKSFYPPKLLGLATFNSIMRTTLGINPNAQFNEHQPFVHELHKVFQYFQTKIFVPLLRNNFISSLFGWRQDEDRLLTYGSNFAHSILKDLKTDMKNSEDIVAESRTSLAELLLRHPEFTMDEMKSQILTIIAAGMDTSMIQNSLMLIMLAIHPKIQDRVYEEIVHVLGDDIGQCPTYEDLMKLEYLDRVIRECLRMYPAAPIIGRQVTQDIKVTTEEGKEYIFPTGTAVVMLLYHIQESPDYYENPSTFDPDRWLPQNIEKRNPHCYIPFSSGPRNCIGGKYAILQMKTILSNILRKYKVMPSENCKTLKDVKVRMNLTMELKHHCHITLTDRTSE